MSEPDAVTVTPAEVLEKLRAKLLTPRSTHGIHDPLEKVLVRQYFLSGGYDVEEIVRTVHERGGDVDKNYVYAAALLILKEACRNGDVEKVRGLAPEIAKLCQPHSHWPLLDAANYYDWFQQFVPVHPSDKESEDRPLDIALASNKPGNLEVLNILLDSGARYIRTGSDKTMMKLATNPSKNTPGMIRAFVKARTQDGEEVAKHTYLEGLLFAAKQGLLDNIKAFVECGAEVNGESYVPEVGMGCPSDALTVAQHYGKIDACKLLIELGAKPSQAVIQKFKTDKAAAQHTISNIDAIFQAAGIAQDGPAVARLQRTAGPGGAALAG